MLDAADPYFLRLLKFAPFERRTGGWRFGTRRIGAATVARLIASGRAVQIDGRIVAAKRSEP